MNDLSVDLAQTAVTAPKDNEKVVIDSDIQPLPILSPARDEIPPPALIPRQGHPANLQLSKTPTFLATALLNIFAHAIGSKHIPAQVAIAAEALSRHLPGSDQPRWRVEVRKERNGWPGIGERVDLRMIVWISVRNGEKSIWAGEIMVHLLVPDGGKGQGKVETVAWRFGPGPGPEGNQQVTDGKQWVGGEWDDWRMLHLTRYFAIQVEEASGEKRGGTEELVRIRLRKGKAIDADSVVALVFRGVVKALGKPYQLSREELERVIKRVATRLEGEGKETGTVVVTRGFRKSGSNDTYIPSAFVEVHCRKAENAGLGALGKAAAVVLIDVWADGGMKLMGVMYGGEEPVAHFYRSRYPPPESTNIERANAQRDRSAQADGGHQVLDSKTEGIKGSVGSSEDIKEEERPAIQQ